jgi:hypothetical protein
VEITTLIEASAEVSRIVTLRPGDVYKRLPDANDYNAKNQMRFGVIQDVLNNGSDTAITAIEFSVNYNDVRPEIKTFRGASDLAVWPATPAEVTAHLGEVEEAARNMVLAAERDLATKRGVYVAIQGTLQRSAELTAPQAVGA